MRTIRVVGRKLINKKKKDFKVIYSDSGYKVVEYDISPGNLHLLDQITQEAGNIFIGWIRAETKDEALREFSRIFRKFLGVK